MKAARLYQYDARFNGPQFLKLEDVGDPKLQDADDVIVRIGGAGLCRTDLHITDGVWPACRRGNDMHCENGAFPGITRDGGFAQYLQIKERNLVRLPESVAPKQIAPHADAGLTA